MTNFPYITDFVNETFEKEKLRFDFIFIRPFLVVGYFFLRLVVFPLKFLFHRREYGYEHTCIDSILSFGVKYFASHEAAELIVRHMQIEPLLYRFLLTANDEHTAEGIHGDFTVDTASDVVKNKMTIAHDDLSYEIVENFDKKKFLEEIERFRNSRPEDHETFGKGVLEENKKHSLQWFGCTNVVIFVVIIITIFGDLRSVIRALNSFGSDSLVLWCMKHIYADSKDAQIDLDFYMQESNNRSHYHSSPFLSDPSQYLFYHIAFDEYAYELLRKNPEQVTA